MTTPSGSFTYKYNDGGNRIYKTNGTIKEYYLYDHTGRVRRGGLIYDMNTGNLKTANIYLPASAGRPAVEGGSGLIGGVDISGGATGGYYERLYYVKDHLGSTRVTISTVETGNNVAYASDYYPFGESIREFQVGTKGGKYKFTEKERDAESSYDYFGARYYNNKLGIWLSVDPLAEKYPGWNPFNYCINNPIRLIDPTGMSFEDGWTTTYKANYTGGQYDETVDRVSSVFALGYNDGKKGDPLANDYYINSRSYSREKYAVLGATSDFANLEGQNTKNEYGCFIVKKGNSFYYTNFTEGSDGHWIQSKDPIPLINLAKDIGATAFWHQHRDPRLSQTLSYGDVNAQRITGLRVYATIPNGDVQGFNLNKYDWLMSVRPNDRDENFRQSIRFLYKRK